MRKMSRKGQTIGIQALAAIAIILVVAGITVGFGGKILSDIDTSLEDGDVNTTTQAQNVLGNYSAGLLNLSSNVGTLGTIIIAAVIIGVVATAFIVRSGNGRL